MEEGLPISNGTGEPGCDQNPTGARRKWTMKAAADTIIITGRTVSKWKMKSYKSLCEICKGLELDIDKFIIQDHSSDRSQQAYKSYLHPAKVRKTAKYSMLSGSGKMSLGSLEDIRTRSAKCPFCSLVVQALFDFQQNNMDEDCAKRSFCYASWQVDGREVIRDEFGRVTSSRPRTRRIQLHWNNADFHDSYLVLMAPEVYRLPYDKKRIWESETLFLGRNISSAGNNQSLVKGWLDLCHSTHGQLCKIDRVPEFNEMISQTYFGVVDVHEMRLTSLPPDERYIALSYMWGVGERYTTDITNIELHRSYGGLERIYAKLPRTIRDAIKLVRGLGERYIWIDSLCIVQNSKASWKLNSAVMDLVYGNAHLTICAADGDGAMAGLKGLSPSERYVSQHTEECAQNLRLMVSHLAETYIKRSRWNARAWTFQERLLSRRCLIFTEGRVYFQCRSAAMSEDIAAEQDDVGWSIELVQAPLQMLHDLSSRAFWVYAQCVNLYTVRKLGRARDVLAAFNGMSNMLGQKMGSPLVFGLPSSHFDLAMLWEPKTGSRRRVPRSQREIEDFDGMEFPSWAWCGWTDAAIEYRKTTIAGCLSNVHQWLVAHTWIEWYIRDGHGNLRPVWNSKIAVQHPSTEFRWRGYGAIYDNNPEVTDDYGRTMTKELKSLERSKFIRTLPEYPYRVSIVESNSKPDQTFPDQRFLQFRTWSAFLRLIPQTQPPNGSLGVGLSRYDIADYTGDWCGTIVLDDVWAGQQSSGSEHEFIAISDAKEFSEEENDVWTYYIPKEKEQSEWDLYYVLLVERRLGIAHRMGLGKVFKEAFGNSCLPGCEWKEVILE